VALVPDLLSGGLIAGARHGRGFSTCRVGDAWSAPAPITISGASFGPQIAVQSVDWMMLVMTDEGLKKMLRAKLTFGAACRYLLGPSTNRGAVVLAVARVCPDSCTASDGEADTQSFMSGHAAVSATAPALLPSETTTSS
jgi:lipid-binding SYLF domain-containing protein